MRPGRTNKRSKMADIRPERADFRPERADYRPEKANFRLERGEMDELKDGQKEGWTDG